MLELMILAVIIFSVAYKTGALKQDPKHRKNRKNANSIFGSKKTGTEERKRIPSHMEDSAKRIMTGASAGSGKSYRNYGEDAHRSKRKIALRLMEGDPVPEGYVCMGCHYCGAENLIRRNSRDYHCCYFCREALD